MSEDTEFQTVGLFESIVMEYIGVYFRFAVSFDMGNKSRRFYLRTKLHTTSSLEKAREPDFESDLEPLLLKSIEEIVFTAPDAVLNAENVAAAFTDIALMCIRALSRPGSRGLVFDKDEPMSHNEVGVVLKIAFAAFPKFRDEAPLIIEDSLRKTFENVKL